MPLGRKWAQKKSGGYRQAGVSFPLSARSRLLQTNAEFIGALAEMQVL
jgi:hypothetical protein